MLVFTRKREALCRGLVLGTALPGSVVGTELGTCASFGGVGSARRGGEGRNPSQMGWAPLMAPGVEGLAVGPAFC